MAQTGILPLRMLPFPIALRDSGLSFLIKKKKMTLAISSAFISSKQYRPISLQLRMSTVLYYIFWSLTGIWYGALAEENC